MAQLISQLKRFTSDEGGLETIEYAVMTAMIVAGIVAALTSIGGILNDRFNSTQGIIDGI